jgi:hypothetical protein
MSATMGSEQEREFLQNQMTTSLEDATCFQRRFFSVSQNQLELVCLLQVIEWG